MDVQGEEYEDLSPYTGMVMEFVDTKGFESREDDKNRRPAMIKGERKMDEKLVGQRLGDMVFLDDIIDMLKTSMSASQNQKKRD